ncbi:hypothetical protein GUJ93_ZPchr0012g19948 [Zizania palustris]|uniref:Uncharacterized protein n=1 Tax=Zizania palustris TaxID=103762 RepID=A0A8J6BTE6_ZIZPA|nr:hypothetical protein GUJ93_ZPchr0012g19948 [Zizania palustris]
MSAGGDGERDCRSGLRMEAGLERGAAADGRLVEDRARIDRPPNQLAGNGDRPSRRSVWRSKEGSRRLLARVGEERFGIRMSREKGARKGLNAPKIPNNLKGVFAKMTAGHTSQY